MKRTSQLLLFFICLPIFGQDLPDLRFEDLNLTYGDGGFELKASSNNSQGKISYEVIWWKSDKDDSEQGDNPVVEEYYGYWFIMNAGEAIVKATIADWENYSKHSVTAKITVNKKPISVRVNAAERIYGASNPPYEFTITSGGFVYKEDVSALNPAPKYKDIEKNADVNDGINPTQYPITFTSEAKWNYEFTVEPNYLTIKKADLSIVNIYPEGTSSYIETGGDTIFYYEKEYGEENHTFAADWEPVEGLMEWDNKGIVTGNLQIDAGSIDRLTDCDTIPLPLDVSEMSSKNYNVKPADGAKATLIIQPRPLTLRAEDETVEYGEINATNNSSSLKFEANWIKPSDKDNFEQVPKLYIDALNTIDVGGPYTGLIKFSSAGAHKNYKLHIDSTVNGDLTIKMAPLTIYPKSYTTIYKSPVEISCEIYIDRLKNDRDIERFRDVYSLQRVNGNLYNGIDFLEYDIGDTVGIYEISINQSKLVINEKNYDVEIRDGSYTINRADLTINIEDINVFVGDTLPALNPPGLSVNHKDNYDPVELNHYLGSECLSIENFNSENPGTFDINCNTVDLANYEHMINRGKLTVYAHAFIDSTTEKLKVCRDAGGAMAVSSKSVGKTYEWSIQLPGVDTFQIIDPSTIDTLKLSGINTSELRLDSALVRHEDYYFKCKLTSTIKVYPDRDSLERKTEIESGPIGIEIKDTPPFAKVILKGGAILISGDPYADSYKWYKSGEEAVLDSTQYLDIYGDESNADQYYVITSNMNGCSTKSSRLTEDGDNGKVRYYPDSLVISISPNPVRKGGIIKITATDLVDGDPFEISIYNQMGEQKDNKAGKVIWQTLVSLKLDELNIEPGIYYLNLTHNSMRSSKVLLVSD